MSTDELAAAKDYIKENLEKGFIEASRAPFGSPILMARKANGGFRFCVDYRRLNAATKKNRYPLPLIDETLARLTGARYFSKIDVRQAFHRIRIHEDSKDLTTFRTRYGSYRYNVLPFGLCNGPATFQQYMNEVMIDGLDDFCSVFIDDILVYSKTRKEHWEQVRRVLKKLKEAGLQADIKKCEFEVTETRFLSLIVGRDGIRMDPQKVAAILKWKAPTSLRGVRSFLGLCNYYRRFIKNYSRIAKPLTDLTKNTVAWAWTQKCEAAFQALKDAVRSDPVLWHFDPAKPIFLEVDSSDYVSGGVLSQKDEEGRLHPVAYFSKKLSDTECNYTIYDKELFAIVRAFQEWSPECRSAQEPIQVFTDHETLKTFMTNKQLSRRQIRWAEELAEYDFKIVPIAGKKNERADALSRREQDLPADESDSRLTSMNRTALPPGSFTLAPLEPLEDPDLPTELRTANRADDALTAIRQDVGKHPEYSVRDGLLIFQENRLVVPQNDRLRLRLIQAAHRPLATGHPGIQRTWELLKERYYWNGMKKAVKRYVQNCHSCKRAKYKTESYNGLLKPLPIGDQPWKHLSCDFVTKLPNFKGFTAVLVVVDRFSKMRHFIPCHDTTTASQMAQLFRDNIWKYHGLPDTIISDRGPQFISEFWQGLCKLLQIDHRLSTAYHPEMDGQTENANKEIEVYLRHYVSYHQDD
ncbi:uncharacterized protein ACHE_50633A [Neofusicoccum parvum]|nr:uncharacterized protein ACHE_50633A [Neofusicoccum parvum]